MILFITFSIFNRVFPNIKLHQIYKNYGEKRQFLIKSDTKDIFEKIIGACKVKIGENTEILHIVGKMM